MATRPEECGSCGKDHPSARPCPDPKHVEPFHPPRTRTVLISFQAVVLKGEPAENIEQTVTDYMDAAPFCGRKGGKIQMLRDTFGFRVEDSTD